MEASSGQIVGTGSSFVVVVDHLPFLTASYSEASSNRSSNVKILSEKMKTLAANKNVDASYVIKTIEMMTSYSPISFFNLITTLLSLVMFKYILDFLWTLYHRKLAYDPDAGDVINVPLPPGSYGTPLIGETLSWLRLVSILLVLTTNYNLKLP